MVLRYELVTVCSILLTVQKMRAIAVLFLATFTKNVAIANL